MAMTAIRPWGPGIHSNPMFGFVFGLGLDTTMTENLGALALRGNPVYPGNSSADDFDWSLFINGSLKLNQSNPDLFSLPRPAQPIKWRVDVIGLLRDSMRADMADCDFFHALPSGEYVRLSWEDIPDDADFDAYLLYWNEGVPGRTTLLAAITDEKQYIAGPLATGTYTFWILYRDVYGNIGNGIGGNNGQTRTVYINAPPAAPTAALVGIDDIASGVARDVSFTVTAPDDTTGIVGYRLAVNQFPCLMDLLNAETSTAFLRPVSVGANTIHVYPGSWRLQVFSVTKYGQLSSPASLDFRYLDDGAGGLTYVEGAPPAKIVSIYAYPGAAGSVTVVVQCSVGAGGGVIFYRDGSAVDDQPFAEGVSGVFTLVQTGLTSGQAYSYHARAYDAPGALGEASHAVSVVADSTPPSGDQILSAEVI